MKKTFTFITMMFLCSLLSAQTVSVTFSGRLAENEEYLPHPVPLQLTSLMFSDVL